MKRFIAIPLLVISFYLLFNSCGQNLPIPEENFIKIYAGMTIMQDTSALSQSEIKKKILSKYHYSEKDYNQTIEFYNLNSDKWAKFFDKVAAYVESLKIKTKKVEFLVLPRRYVLKDN